MDKKSRRIIIGLYILTIIVACSYATQRIAELLNYQEALYWSIFDQGTYKIYFPFSWLAWWYSFRSPATEWFFNKYGFNAVSIVTITFGVMILFIRMYLKPNQTDNHGSAHWATKQEIIDLGKKDPPGLLTNSGVILGTLDSGEYIRDNSKTHVLVCAPTRSGKGVGIIIPTLLTWTESVVVTDLKGENWQLTSGWRQKKLNNKVYKFEPTDINSHRYNPFDEIRIRTEYEIRDIQNIVKIFVDPTGKGSEGESAHWILSAGALLTGVILHLKYLKKDMNIYDVLNFFYGEDNTFSDFETDESEIEDYIDPDSEDSDGNNGESGNIVNTQVQIKLTFIVAAGVEHDPTGELFKKIYNEETKFHPIVRQYFNKMINTPDKEFGSILSTLDTILDTYRDPIIAKNMSSSDFSIEDIMNNEQPISLYLVVPPSDLDRVKPLFRVIVELLYRKNTEEMKFEDGKQIERKHKMLMLMDEFPALGKLETIERAMAYVAGYGIKFMIITQDINQITKLYTESNSIVSNCQVQVYHTPTDNKTPKFISEMMGKQTIWTKSFSYNGSLMNIGSRSTSLQETGRQLLTSDEVKTFDRSKEIIIVAGVSPIKANKIKYYENWHFKDRPRIGGEAEIVRDSKNENFLYDMST